MSSIGSGYDLSATTFSPEGRVFQVEYAAKAVEIGGTVIGLTCKDGIVFGVEKVIISKMLVKGTSKRLHTVDLTTGIADCGLVADGRQLVNRARSECEGYRSFYGKNIPTKLLTERLASYMHLFTLYGHVRPFGSAVLVGSYEQGGKPELYLAEPSGDVHKYYACAIGKGRQTAKTELEKLNLQELTCRQAVVEVARIIQVSQEENREKQFELQMSWISDETNRQHVLVPDDLVTQAQQKAKAAIDGGNGTGMADD
jgi:20S proteasome subunit alpha 7